MQDNIQLFILELLKKKSNLPKDFNEKNDFIKAGIIDSIGIIKFILEIEYKFNIEITDFDIESNDFRTVQGLVKIIEIKIQHIK